MPLNTISQNPLQVDERADGDVTSPAMTVVRALALVSATSVAARTGVFDQLASGPASLTDLAARLTLEEVPLEATLNVLVTRGLLDYSGHEYSLPASGWRWLDPDSPTSIVTYLSSAADHALPYLDLESLVAGRFTPPPPPDAGDERAWLRRVRAEYEIARLISDELATTIGLPENARSIIELGSGHGAFSAALCRANPLLRATVIDRAGAISIGREISWETGMDRVVSFEPGDPATVELGGPYDAVLCPAALLPVGHERSSALLRRIRLALNPGATLVVVDTDPLGPPPACGNIDAVALSLLRAVRSGGRTSAEVLPVEVTHAGFGQSRTYRLVGAPNVIVQVAQAV